MADRPSVVSLRWTMGLRGMAGLTPPKRLIVPFSFSSISLGQLQAAAWLEASPAAEPTARNMPIEIADNRIVRG